MRIILFAFFLVNILFVTVRAQDTSKTKRAHAWWNEPPPPRSKPSPKAGMLPLVHVYKNKFVNAKGDTILFRGVSIADPDKIDGQGMWNKQLFEEVRKLGTMLVRIPVHPAAWRERGHVQYLQLLDSAASWCTDL